MQAKSLHNAIDNFNELQPLIFQQEKGKEVMLSASSEFYMERPDNPLEEMKIHLIQSRLPEKILLTGHMGSGKSTELNRLAVDKEIQKKFFVVKYGIREVLNILDIDYLDFLLSFGAVVFTRAMEGGITFDSKILDRISTWISFAQSGADMPKRLNEGKNKKEKAYNFFKSVITILMREVSLRDTMRKSIQRNVSELVEVINLTISQIQTSLPQGQELLVIIDDLEKVPDRARAEELFARAGMYMVTPQCKIVYTMPIALYYSVGFKQIVNIFSKAYFLRNIKLQQQDSGADIPEGYELLDNFLKKRIALNLIDQNAQKEMCRYSGGVVRELIRIAKDSIIKSLAVKRETITLDIVNAVVAELRNEYGRGLTAKHYLVMDTIANKQNTDDEKTAMDLYHARVLLEYENGGRWTAVNPIVQPLLEKHRRGIR